MKERRALATLAIGETYSRLFHERCEDNWRAYCKRHGIDLVVLEKPLDESARAASRSPAWQKCLILEHPGLEHYDQVCWIDTDILIHPSAPSVFEGVPLGKVAGVDAYAAPNRDVYRGVLARMYESWRNLGAAFLDCPTPESFYAKRGIENGPGHVMHTGVMIASPARHAALFRQVYDAYEDTGGKGVNYEWAPLSYEVVTQGLEHWLDFRFNLILSDQIEHHYRFLHHDLFGKLLAQGQEATAQALNRIVFDACLNAIFDNAYFLHFCGLQDLMGEFRAP
jgi:hypothetical protein